MSKCTISVGRTEGGNYYHVKCEDNNSFEKVADEIMLDDGIVKHFDIHKNDSRNDINLIPKTLLDEDFMFRHISNACQRADIEIVI